MRKNDKRNLDTKKRLAEGFKKLALKKPMNKITINELTKYCGVNRNTFYYHFLDIKELMEWILFNEITILLESVDIKNIQNLYYSVFNYVDDNKELLKNAYKVYGRENLRLLLYPYFYKTLDYLIEEMGEISCDTNFKDFVINFYSDGIAFAITDYINNNQDKEKIIKYLLLMNNNLENILNIKERA